MGKKSNESKRWLMLNKRREKKLFSFGMTWGWVSNDGNFIFGWTIPSKENQFNTVCKLQYDNVFPQLKTVGCDFNILINSVYYHDDLNRRNHHIWTVVGVFRYEMRWAPAAEWSSVSSLCWVTGWVWERERERERLVSRLTNKAADLRA